MLDEDGLNQLPVRGVCVCVSLCRERAGLLDSFNSAGHGWRSELSSVWGWLLGSGLDRPRLKVAGGSKRDCYPTRFR